MPSLLDRAKTISVKRRMNGIPIGEEDVELFVAYGNHVISRTQIIAVKAINNNRFNGWFQAVVMMLAHTGRLQVKDPVRAQQR